ncbi:MAG: ABC transporter substrate-binding protein [Candidatus Zixiibacteriota bacterium]|nr:MAG: ABC transporter substrate-binding protein [candidate division Zixibacteria bacterium]
MKILICCLAAILSFGLSYADTQDYIKCSVIHKTPNVIYFDAGSSDGVVPGEEFEVYYDERVVARGKIEWSDRNISRSTELSSAVFADIYYYDDLTAKIRLYVAISNKGGSLVIPYFSELGLGPSTIDTPDEKMVARLIHRGLFTRDQNGFVVSDLASVYEVRGLTYTFYIDPDAVFHSGKPVEAADVAYSLEQLAKSTKLTPGSSFVLAVRGAREFRYGTTGEIAGVFLIDKKTISITLNKPFPAFIDYLAGPGGYIIPKPGIIPTGGNVIGAGPYKIKWRDLNSIALEPFDRELSEVYLDSLIFLRFNNAEEAALSMELGRLDLIPILGEPLPKFISSSSHTSLTGKTFCPVLLGFNGDRDYQKDSNFSRALSFLIDRESIVRVILGGSAALPDTPLPGFDETSVNYDYALIPDSVDFYMNRISKMPEKIIFYVDSRYSILSKVSRYISGQLSSRGIKVTERKVDFSYLDENRVKSELDMYLGYYNPVCENPDCMLYPLYNFGLSGHTNYLYYRDNAFQSFLDNLRSETDPERRNMLSYGLAQSLAYEPPAIILYEPYLMVISKTDISGIKATGEGYIDLRGAFIEKDR